MFPEDTKDMLMIYEPVEGMSDESGNWKKKQMGYIHRSCLLKAASLKPNNEERNSSSSGVV